MTSILIVTASMFGQNGQSSQLVSQTLEKLRAQYPDAKEVHRDLAEQPVPHLDATRFGAFLTGADERNSEQQDVVAYSDELIQEIQSADVIVMGVPMYNFGIPSTLKAYFDHIARAGITFRYTENGPVGLLKDRPVYVLAARRGIYAGTTSDSQTPYIRSFLGFLGLTQVEFIYAEGLNLGDDHKASAITRAHGDIAALEV